MSSETQATRVPLYHFDYFVLHSSCNHPSSDISSYVRGEEIFRCEHPEEEEVLHQLLGYKITLSILGNPIPSVVYHDIPQSYHRPLQYAHVRTAERKMKLCASTMVFISGLRPLLAEDQPGFAPMDAYAASSVVNYPAAA
ncbi:hypothetical protein SUGI_0754500 [Cryptomeria japonica]|nr:hypothetical protein SUGI_0754500 [Cryptomeria japonica]